MTYRHGAIVCLLALGLSGSSAHAVFLNGNKLHEWCQEQPAAAAQYVVGVLDALMVAAATDASNQPVCIPTQVTVRQVYDVVCKHLRDNPANRHYNTPSLVWHAQSEAWPCKK
jgi:Rap1a immunity proteins